jgi:hypothetical protein
MVQPIFLVSKVVLQNWVWRGLFVSLVPLINFLLVLIPVKHFLGNSISFQANLFGISGYLLLILVAALESLLLVIFIYLLQHAPDHLEAA